MNVGVVKESFPGEHRVALTPHVLPSLTKAGCDVLIEGGAGLAAGYPDAAYTEKGAKIAADRGEVFASADVILQVRGFGANLENGRSDLGLMRKGQTVIAQFEPLTSLDAVKDTAGTGATLFAMELIPRITFWGACDPSLVHFSPNWSEVILDTSPRGRFRGLMDASDELYPGVLLY